MFQFRIWTTTGHLTIKAVKVIWAPALVACVACFVWQGRAWAQNAAPPTLPAPGALTGQTVSLALTAFSKSSPPYLPVPWRLIGLPKNKAPLAQIEIAILGDERVLKLATDKSYGAAVHELTPQVLGPGSILRWRWRLESPLALADLKTKEGDDAALKVCAMFDMPVGKLGFLERNLLRLARGLSGEKLPAATLCYVWDNKLPVGTGLPNAFTPRLRYLVMDSGERRIGQWVTHERDLAQDIQKAFGHEFDTPPPLIAVLAGADSDNTQGRSLAYVGDLSLSVKAPE